MKRSINNMSQPPKRTKIKAHKPNPLFEKWLKEWEDEAKARKSPSEKTYSFALKSLKKYPLPLECGKHCMILKGFGKKICAMLDEKLRMECADNKDTLVDLNSTIIYQYDNSKNVVAIQDEVDEDKANIQTQESVNKFINGNKNKIDSVYYPAYKTEGFAILICLLQESLNGNMTGLTTSQMMEKGAIYCEAELKCKYSISKLLRASLLAKSSKPVKYLLTDQGEILAKELYTKYKIEIDSLNQSTTKEITHPVTSTIEAQTFEENEKTTHSAQKTILTSLTNTLIFPPLTFDVILLVDNQETLGKQKSFEDKVIQELHKQKIKFEVRHLKVGDFGWVCQQKNTQNELVLPYIVERKRMDDFGASIQDGRYHEQKFRLKECGLQNVIYLIEEIDNVHTRLPLPTLHQAATNTLVHDGFAVKFTRNLKGTIEYISCLTSILTTKYMNKTLISCPKENVEASELDDDLISLMKFDEFNKNAAKNKPLEVKDLLIKQLMQLSGISVDKALAIAKKYPTPLLLAEALSSAGPDGKIIAEIKFGAMNKKIGAAIGRKIYLLYTKQCF